MSPDGMVFMLAFNTYFGVERPIYAVAHSMVTSWPVIGTLGRRWGVITAGHKAARTAFDAGACVIVYPGGDVETHRPWSARNEVRFDGRGGSSGWPRRPACPLSPWWRTGARRR